MELSYYTNRLNWSDASIMHYNLVVTYFIQVLSAAATIWIRVPEVELPPLRWLTHCVLYVQCWLSKLFTAQHIKYFDRQQHCRSISAKDNAKMLK